jgi:hypothetical protein
VSIKNNILLRFQIILFPKTNLRRKQMAKTDLLKEAIADAKAVKETAIANAKLALEEAFTPHLKSMLSAKLEEMDKEDVDEGYDEDVKEEVSEDTVAEEKEEMDEAKEELDEINLDELLAELELDEDKRTDAEQEGYKDGFEDAKDDIEAELKKMKVSEEMKDKDDVKEEMKDKDDVKEDARTDAEEEGYLDGMKDEKEDMDDKDDEEIDLEDMSEDDLKGFIEDVIKDLVADGTIEAGEDFEEVDMMDDVEVEDSVDVDVEIDEAKADDDKDKMEEASRVKGEKGVGNEDGDKDDSKIEKETEKMRFKEAIDEINELKKELNEVNLLNAKLLYTNKIFKSKNLSEDKKVKVLKAFDKASTVKEAKVIFETLNEGLVSKSVVNVRPQGSASKATGTITEAKKPIIESNDVYNRMRKLAGLI